MAIAGHDDPAVPSGFLSIKPIVTKWNEYTEGNEGNQEGGIELGL
jgi:hypothetical protein